MVQTLTLSCPGSIRVWSDTPTAQEDEARGSEQSQWQQQQECISRDLVAVLNRGQPAVQQQTAAFGLCKPSHVHGVESASAIRQGARSFTCLCSRHVVVCV